MTALKFRTDFKDRPEREGPRWMYLCKWDMSKGPRPPRHLPEYKKNTIEAFDVQVTQRHGVILDIEERTVKARHSHVEKPDSTCLACDLERRAAEGRPVFRYSIYVRRRVFPFETKLVPKRARKHRKCGSAAYHKRIQKKWNKQVVGLFQYDYVTEELILDVSPMQLHALSLELQRQARMGTPREPIPRPKPGIRFEEFDDGDE